MCVPLCVCVCGVCVAGGGGGGRGTDGVLCMCVFVAVRVAVFFIHTTLQEGECSRTARHHYKIRKLRTPWCEDDCSPSKLTPIQAGQTCVFVLFWSVCVAFVAGCFCF